MAELPDLTVFAEILTKHFKHKLLDRVEILVTKKLNTSVDHLKSEISNKKLKEVTRYGKTLRLLFTGGAVLQIHLMLRGELKLIDETFQPGKSTVIYLLFTNGKGFAVNDPFKQATPLLNPPEVTAPDALDLSASELESILAKASGNVKEVLMNQKLIRGIGNAYADEILWDARISPFSIVSQIPYTEIKKLYHSIGNVLRQAIKDLRKASGDDFKSELRDFMRVYTGKQKTSPTGAAIQSGKINGRSTYYTDEQVLWK